MSPKPKFGEISPGTSIKFENGLMPEIFNPQ
jgi:hypothetical protein